MPDENAYKNANEHVLDNFLKSLLGEISIDELKAIVEGCDECDAAEKYAEEYFAKKHKKKRVKKQG